LAMKAACDEKTRDYIHKEWFTTREKSWQPTTWPVPYESRSQPDRSWTEAGPRRLAGGFWSRPSPLPTEGLVRIILTFANPCPSRRSYPESGWVRNDPTETPESRRHPARRDLHPSTRN
jgi:hypothetical protein